MLGKFHIFAIIASIIVITLSVFSIYAAPVAIERLDVKFEIGENIGFDLNDSVISFGKVIPGGYGERKVKLNNNKEYPLIIKIYKSKSLNGLVSSEQDIIINPGEEKEVSLILSVPEDSEYGSYEGEIIFRFYRFRD